MADLKRQSKQSPRARLTEFSEWFKGNDNNPSFNNRYSTMFSTPAIFRSGTSFQKSKFELEVGDNANYLNFYADNINLPSKQVTTGQITNIGSSFNYATSSTFSQINITFTMPRSHKTRMIFERWINLMSSDANQMTDYYENYVCPNLFIFKWERGGGAKITLPPEIKNFLKKLGVKISDVERYRDDQLVGVYDIRNAFPFNIGSMTLSNDTASILKMDVGFYYERYRFFGQDKFDNLGSSYLATGEVGLTADLSLDRFNS